MGEVIYETIAEVSDTGMARVLVAALRGYGFHPLERDDEGPFGLAAFTTQRGLPVEVPEAEATDARALAEALLADMAGRKSAT
jgi:hypothetical protein